MQGWCVAFLLCAGVVASAQAPVRLESRVDATGGGEAVMTNLKAVPLTAAMTGFENDSQIDLKMARRSE